MSNVQWNDSLVESMKRGDHQAFEQCYKSTSTDVYTVIFNICRDHGVAEELLHDTYIDVLQYIHQYQCRQSLLAWIKRIAFNNTLNFIRKHKRLVLVEDSFYGSIELDDDSIKQVSDRNLLEVVLRRVSEEERLVLWLFIVEQYSHDEISVLVGKTASYSKSIVSRTLKKIRLSHQVQEYAYK